MKKHPKKKSVSSKTHLFFFRHTCFFFEGQISTFSKIMLKKKLFVEKRIEKTPPQKKSLFSKTHFVFFEGQISTFYKIMVKTKLFLEKRIEKTPSKQNQLMLE